MPDLRYLESRGTDPYENLALEEYLQHHCGEREIILYLWQNRDTVVIGRNQDPRCECDLDQMARDGVLSARRNSGGGAVFHDMGNLNFSFLARKGLYLPERQTEVVRLALAMLGVSAAAEGRNDLLVEGKKISGSAFYVSGDLCCHHGTIMLDVDLHKLTRYLTVPEEKLKSKGVASVRSRVANLREFSPDMTIDSLKDSLRTAFAQVYGSPVHKIPVESVDMAEVSRRREHLASPGWILGRQVSFTNRLTHRFPWGTLDLRFQVQDGVVRDVSIFSDALNLALPEWLPEILRGRRYHAAVLCEALEQYKAEEPGDERIRMDILSWFQDVDPQESVVCSGGGNGDGTTV